MPRQIQQPYPDLVKKAQKLFWTQGFKSVTPEELAKEMGVSKSSIYNKFTKEMLFIDALEDYMSSMSDPILSKIRNSEKGLESFVDFFDIVIVGLLDYQFPKSCLMVNTVVEMRHENELVVDMYDKYYSLIKMSYNTILNRSFRLGELKQTERKAEYLDFLMGVLFALSILYKVKTKEELQLYVKNQLAMLK